MKRLLCTLLLALLFAGASARRPDTPPHRPPRMSDREFAVLYGHVEKKTFKEDRLLLIEIGSLDSRFDVGQCLRLLGFFDFDDDKLRALALLAPHLVDRRGADRILEGFDFESNRRRAAELLFGGR